MRDGQAGLSHPPERPGAGCFGEWALRPFRGIVMTFKGRYRFYMVLTLDLGFPAHGAKGFFSRV